MKTIYLYILFLTIYIFSLTCVYIVCNAQTWHELNWSIKVIACFGSQIIFVPAVYALYENINKHFK